MTAEVVAGWHLDRQIRDAELFVDRQLTPEAGVSGIRPRVFQPRVVAELTGLRNRVEDPAALAGSRVEGSHEALRVRAAPRRAAGAVRGADEDDVSGDDGRAVPGDIGGDRIELLVVVLLQIDDPLLAESRQRRTGLRVEADELVADGHVENPIVAAAVGPVADAAP